MRRGLLWEDLGREFPKQKGPGANREVGKGPAPPRNQNGGQVERAENGGLQGPVDSVQDSLLPGPTRRWERRRPPRTLPVQWTRVMTWWLSEAEKCLLIGGAEKRPKSRPLAGVSGDFRINFWVRLWEGGNLAARAGSGHHLSLQRVPSTY